MSKPRYTVIKDHLIQRIERKSLCAGDRVPSENELAANFDVSRMTARRALQELSDEGILVRSQGLGSFVADARPLSSVLEIHSIDAEIRSRGHEHRAEVLGLQTAAADHRTALLLELGEGEPVFHSVVLHWEGKQPLQYEERFVNPRFGGDYLEQDFSRVTPSSYLSGISPLTEADQAIEAICAEASVADLLRIKRREPCLKLNRRTWCQRGIVNIATLIYPGSRYRLGGHLTTENGSQL
jgi:GntR family histidine utilization transcriptional repressor